MADVFVCKAGSRKAVCGRPASAPAARTATVPRRETLSSLASERAMLSQIDAYVGGDGGWASGEVDPDEDDYPSSGGSNGEDFGADDY